MNVKLWKVIVVAVVVVVALSGAVYAMDYRGNANLDMTFTVVCGTVSTSAAISNVAYESEATSPWDIWSLRGHASSEWTHMLLVTLDPDGDALEGKRFFVLEASSTMDVLVEFDNIETGVYDYVVELHDRSVLAAVYAGQGQVVVG
jgi:hypothetical protein